MTDRQRSTETTEPKNSPKENTSPVLRLFVYGTLKRGYGNHDRFCQGVLEIREAQVRGRLYEGPGFPVLEVRVNNVRNDDPDILVPVLG